MLPAPRPLFSADPIAGYRAARDEIDAAIRRVLDSGKYILGPEVEAFEQEFTAYLGGRFGVGVAASAQDITCADGPRDETRGHVAAVANGTDALELALRAVGIGPGDRVATVANTVSATASAIVACGAIPVFVEIEPATMLMEPAALARTLAAIPGIKAIVPVHLYGLPCDLPAITAIARKAGVPVVEDCAQAHGAAVDGRRVGTWGELAAFSFYPTKNLAALGDGGAVVGRERALVEKVRLLRQYGWRNRYVSDTAGRNSRLDEIQAAILRVQLPRLEASNAHRAQLAERYLQALAPIVAHPGGVRDGNRATETTPPGCSTMGDGGRVAAGAVLQLPIVPAGRTHVWHQFVIRTPQRDALRAQLERAGIHCGVLYPVPLHRQAGFQSGERGAGSVAHGAASEERGAGSVEQSGSLLSSSLPTPRSPLPLTERACAEVLSLPLHPGITEADVDRVCAAIREFFARAPQRPADHPRQFA